jgi:hypothetical protein
VGDRLLPRTDAGAVTQGIGAAAGVGVAVAIGVVVAGFAALELRGAAAVPDRKGRGWSEPCTLWDDGRRFAVAVDTSDYPYLLQVMRGSWSVDRLAEVRSRLGMTFLFRPRPGLRGRLSVWAMHAGFLVMARWILRGWNDAVS